MITLITGGERSGKSTFAQEIALSRSESPIYLATANIPDDDFRRRVSRHQEERDDRWTTIEEHYEISKVLPPSGTVVIDCVTLWLSNYFGKMKGDIDTILFEARREIDTMSAYHGELIFVTNEVGMGLHAATKLGRDFVEVQGWINQYISRYATTVYFMVAGNPLKIKPQTSDQHYCQPSR